jgi:hypothetical protein
MCSLVRDDPRRFVTSGTAPGGLETVPSNESHLLACSERITSEARFNERARRSSERGSMRRLAFSGSRVSAVEHEHLNCEAPKRLHVGNSAEPHTSPRAQITPVACQSSALIASPPSTRTDAHDLTEGTSESRLIRKAHLIRNISQRLARVHQELLGTFNPALHQPSVSRDTEARLE